MGNFPGSALCATVSKDALQTPANTPISSPSLQEAAAQVPQNAVKVSAYPSKSTALRLSDKARSADDADSSALIFRSDSNGEDLEG